jgi:hypothetical protein
MPETTRPANVTMETLRKGYTMTVGVVYEFEGTTLGQYDDILKLLGMTPKGTSEPGSLFHWVTGTESGIKVTDVWESQEAFEKFGAERVGPYAQQLGFPNPPVVTYFEVHNYLTGE